MNRKQRRLAKKKDKKGRASVAHSSSRPPQKLFADAVEAFQSGRLDQAEVMTDRLMKTVPPSADLLRLRGSIEFARQNHAAAIPYFRKALGLDPANSALCDLLGTSLTETGQFDDAVASFRRALLADRRNPGTLNNLGLALLQQGQLDKAKAAFQDSLVYRPKDVQTLLNLARVLEEQEDFDAALNLYRGMIEDDARCLQAYQALGECQMMCLDWRGALKTAEQALAAGLVDAEIYTLRGYALGALLDFAGAEASLHKALEIEEDRASALSALSIISFYQEKWRDGWKYYEARQRNPAFTNRPFPQPNWSGEDISGRNILLWGEQGVGDEILFGTMLADLLKRAANVTFEMDPRLVPLFSRSFPEMTCIPRTDPPAPELLGDCFDYQIPSGSLGQFLRPTTESFGAGDAYLVADTDKVERLKQAYATPQKALKVGLAWYSSNGRGLTKSIALKSLSPLFEVPAVRFFDLQYGDTSSERAAFAKETGHQLVHDDSIDQMQSLDDFAAQIAAMDLVISISNTTVHLSGALGIPTWIMLPAAPMQRWLMDRSDSPWYASVELFRQRHENDLAYVVGRIRDRLKQLAD